MSKILQVHNLKTSIKTQDGEKEILKGISLSLEEGEIHGIVGESGSGKTFAAKSILRLHDEKDVNYSGSILYGDKDILKLSEKEMYEIREKEISYVFQNPVSSFDSLFTVGEQIEEVLRYVSGLSKKAAKEKTVKLLESVGVTPAEKRAGQYPFEFSGGMLQRSMIALAIACDPKILIADEATTALDVTMQARVLHLLKKLRDDTGLSILCITHDLGVVAEICDSVTVMFEGKVVETGSVRDIFNNPKEEYTKELLRSFREVS